MWKLKQFMPKEPVGLEGRVVDVGVLKIQIRNAIAEGGFSCVYLARDAIHLSKQYALKHMICNDDESLELAMKEISVMSALKGHPNVVTLLSHAVFDMGRTKEVLLVMEFCEKSLVAVLESRGAGYFDEKQALLVFRDMCNAVCAMHCQSPPIAHRDLKPENLLLAHDGTWKLCDFGSTTTTHKRFTKPEEMGIEEDNIRKYTTPSFRAPEMWDLFRRDVISEKVDIWALGCLLFRICYLKNAFDGESKLQVLNGNYRIPEVPKYSSAVSSLIKDMLQPSPDDRPDILQVWFRVNELLPVDMQKSLPDRAPELPSASLQEGPRKAVSRPHHLPNRSPPPPPSSASGAASAQMGAFWSSHHAKDLFQEETQKGPKVDDVPGASRSEKSVNDNNRNYGSLKEENVGGCAPGKIHNKPCKGVGSQDALSKDFEINLLHDEPYGRRKLPISDKTALFKDEGFNSFVAEFDSSKLDSGACNTKGGSTEALEAEIRKLRDELKLMNSEKVELASKYEKLTVICRSQRQEIQELKNALATSSPSPTKLQASPGTHSPRISSDLGAMSSESPPWKAFSDDPKPQDHLFPKIPHSVRSRNGNRKQQTDQPPSDFDSWGFKADSLAIKPTPFEASSSLGAGSDIKRSTSSKAAENDTSLQPAGWAGFKIKLV